MKHAAKFGLTALIGLGLPFSVALAQNAPPSAVVPPSAATSPVGSAPAAPVLAAPQVSPPEISVVEKINKDADKKNSDVDKAGPRIPESAKNVVKRLDSATQDVTLEDLNAAREVSARLDMLIDIEKKMGDLATLRKDREEKEGLTVPVAALLPPKATGAANNPPPMQAPLPAPEPFVPVAAPVVMTSPVESVALERVQGASGHYIAYLKVGEKDVRVHVGDKISDGSVVTDITSQSVTLTRGKNKPRTLSMKDVGVVSHGR